VGVRIRLGDVARATVGIHGETIDPDSSFADKGSGDNDIDYGFANLPPQLKGAIDETSINGFFFRLVRDTRDYATYPRCGSYTRLSVAANTDILGSDEVFTKATLDISKHFGIGERAAFSTRAAGGIIASTAPYYDRFHIGGIYSIRGFEEWSLSPTDGDDAFWLVSSELRFPLTFTGRTTQPRLTGILFVDAGQGWQRGDEYTSDDVESAAGYGVRLRLPWIGTLGLDTAVPLTQGRTTDDFRVHASLGFSF
jgi:outer membrane protein assembly factor BamA